VSNDDPGSGGGGGGAGVGVRVGGGIFGTGSFLGTTKDSDDGGAT
jgi:hypothetical protein